MKIKAKFINYWRSKIRNMGISKKIAYIYILLFVPLFLGMTLSTYYLSSRYILDMTVEKNMLLLTNAMAQIDNAIKDMDRISKITISDRNLQKILEKGNVRDEYDYLLDQKWLEQFFLNLSTIRNDISIIRILTQNQMLYKYTSPRYSYGGVPNYDYSSEPWIELARSNKGRVAFIGANRVQDFQVPESIPEQSRMVFSVVRQINSVTYNKPVGFIKIDADIDVLESIINKYKDKDSEIILCDSNRNIVYEKDYKHIAEKLGGVLDPSRMEEGQQGNFIMTADNGRMLVTHLTSDYTKWKMICLTPENKFKSIAVLLRNLNLLIIILGVGMSSIASILLSKAITKNIIRLNKSMKKVQTGNLGVILEPLSGDEIGELTATFNTMVTRLNELIQQEYLERIKRQEAEIKEKQAELGVLLNQINPHFLYNTLDTIRITAALNGDKTVEDMLFVLSSFFRLSIYRGEDSTSLEKEMELIKCYMQIHKFRYGDKIECFYHIPNEILDYTIPRFILQPLVENSVHHGLELKKGKGILTIEAAMSDILEITISDNGKGMPEEEIQQYNHMFRENVVTPGKSDSQMPNIGLINVQQRITLKYGRPYGLTLSNNHGGGLTVLVRLPEMNNGNVKMDGFI